MLRLAGGPIGLTGAGEIVIDPTTIYVVLRAVHDHDLCFSNVSTWNRTQFFSKI